ncbi:uncharacterized protein LOC110979955 [Acanthaster planci]|uniref:Uncharacterized protein LOC110979955 n=1 Tax=Acanthaster planci TaxID=133434 RepID=A0A8B7YJW6_ACAPL|nr:uncharacterized protein LOC110979955 [Acanthaster planci]
MSWEKSPSPDSRQNAECGSRTSSRERSSRESSCKEDMSEGHNSTCSPPEQAGCGRVSLSSVSPVGVNSRRNKRKQSEPRRLSTSSLVVKEEPKDSPAHPTDQGRLTTRGLTIETEDDYRYHNSSVVGSSVRDRQRYHHGRHHPQGLDELIPATMLSLQGHTSRASNSSEDSLDLHRVATSTAVPMHSMMSMYRGGDSGGHDGGDGMSGDEAKSDMDDQDDPGSHGTCAESPELMIAEESDAMDGSSPGSNARESTSPDPAASSSSRAGGSSGSRSKKTSRSYKNLSRSRRIVANARERNRVHTISAAFEGLRRAVPSYSHNQKLSKLAILRIACSYILALASLADMDYSPDHQQMSFSECVDMCTKTLQSEGRSKRRKVPLE